MTAIVLPQPASLSQRRRRYRLPLRSTDCLASARGVTRCRRRIRRLPDTSPATLRWELSATGALFRVAAVRNPSASRALGSTFAHCRMQAGDGAVWASSTSMRTGTPGGVRPARGLETGIGSGTVDNACLLRQPSFAGSGHSSVGTSSGYWTSSPPSASQP